MVALRAVIPSEDYPACSPVSCTVGDGSLASAPAMRQANELAVVSVRASAGLMPLVADRALLTSTAPSYHIDISVNHCH
ncbi:hypothetical protein CRG98_045087 [Punica granatum]|uniref:Uncharacterized protein n=1 Tax=Punica granatum TaxID=22663 RepID=A0A2I0HSR6_PUNGR|nr:hypothetical protein CRG98_045087 [Punica granatum]